MADDRPAPPLPPNCDLRNFGDMPLSVNRRAFDRVGAKDEFGIVTEGAKRRALYGRPPRIETKTMAARKPPSRDSRVQQVNPFLVKAAGLYLRGYLDGTASRCVLPLQTVAVNTVVEALSIYLNEPVAIVISARRSRSISRPRQAAMFIARVYCAASLPVIGRVFGNRDHSTVMFAIEAVTDRLRHGDKSTQHAVETLVSIAGVDPRRIDQFFAR